MVRPGETRPAGPYLETDGEVWRLVMAGPNLVPPPPAQPWYWNNGARQWGVLSGGLILVALGQWSWHPLVLLPLVLALAWCRHLVHEIKQKRRRHGAWKP